MRLSNKCLVFAALISTLVGCTKPDKVEGSDEANFYVKSVKGSGAPGRISENNPWRVPEFVTFGFYACVEERTTRKELRNQPMAIYHPDNRPFVVAKTNQNGCLNWSEPVGYNHFAAQSGWVTLKREIVGRGANSGRRAVELAVNPWAAGDDKRDGRPAVVFMRDGADGFKPSGQELFDGPRASMALKGALQGAARLMVQNVKVRAIPEGEGEGWVALLVEVEMEPKIQTRRFNGSVTYESVQDGDFDIEAQILGSNIGPQMDRRVLLMSGEVYAVGKVRDRKLKAEFKLSQRRRAIQGNLELALRVSPRSLNKEKNDYPNVLPFEGLFRFGSGTEVDSMSGSLANACVEPKGCSFDKIIASAANYEDLVAKKYIRNNDRYLFSKLQFRFTSVLPGETATQRTVAYTASTCIKDRQTGRPLADTPMIIRYQETSDGRPKPKPIYKETDESGCLNWSSNIFHKYYDPEEYFENVISIERESGFKREFKFYLNPWDDKFTFGWDAREFDQKFFDDIRKRKKIRSRFFLDSFGYHTVRFLYNIDPFMELEVKKTVLMELDPRVLRYSGIINARKMTEPLRDGIYLLKVAIQKSYLDPRDNSRWMLKNTPERQAKLERVGGSTLVAREFVTSNMALVRVVNGVIIYPIELTMRDLRLMRVRSNFLVQLETVDERLIQAFHVFKRHAMNVNDLEKALKEFKEKLEDKSLRDVTQELGGEVPPALDPLIKQREELAALNNQTKAYEELRAKVADVQELISHNIEGLRRKLENGGAIGFYLSGGGEKTDLPHILATDTLINDNFELSSELLDDLREVLKINDFSEVMLPRKEEIDLNLFVEKNSGLEKRSFVGPVIFLSNAYKDSVRATDNLDEAGCLDPVRGKSTLERSKEALSLKKLEYDEAMAARDKLEGKRTNNAFNYDKYFGSENRQNNAYQFNPFYGSLTHLCYKHVDDLIAKQKQLDKDWVQRYAIMSLKYNFLTSFPFDMDYTSLAHEKLTRVKNGCEGDVSECLEETDDLTVSPEALLQDANQNLDVTTQRANTQIGNVVKRFRGIPFRSEKSSWTLQELPTLFYERKPENTAGLCNILANRIARNLRDHQLSSLPEKVILEKVAEACTHEDGLIHDIKLHVGKTGGYTFLGGLNLNINVGESFSVGSSYSWSGSLELTDFIGTMAGFSKASFLGGPSGGLATGLGYGSNAIKPFSLKLGSSLSESEGTSVSESTYLVSQISKFELDLLSYERCAVIRLSDSAIQYLARAWGDNKILRTIGLSTADFAKEKTLRLVSRGNMVCEGKGGFANNTPKRVKEMYFYFTQHFTEGDMLDQADLYNHPWLLAMRGVRDYTMFVKKIRAQETASLKNYVSKVTGLADPRRMAWALGHMFGLYKNKLPSFPGFYTQLEPHEDIAAFPLEQGFQFSKEDPDPRGEVIRRRLEQPKSRMPERR